MSRRQPSATSATGDATLSDILSTPGLRTELATLTALCSDVMRRDIVAVFEPTRQRTHDREQPKTVGDSLIDFEANEEPPIQDLDSIETERLDLQSPRTQALLMASLTYFDRWQIDVLRRLGEVLSVHSGAVRKARAEAKAHAVVVAKEKQDRAYWEWAHGMEGRVKLEEDPDEADASKILPAGFQAHILTMPKDKRILILDSMVLLLLSLSITVHILVCFY